MAPNTLKSQLSRTYIWLRMGFFSTELAVEADSDSLMLRMKARNNSFICIKIIYSYTTLKILIDNMIFVEMFISKSHVNTSYIIKFSLLFGKLARNLFVHDLWDLRKLALFN